jgi:HAMP domain-containing protein
MSRSQHWTLLIFALSSFIFAAALVALHFQNQRIESKVLADQNKLSSLQDEIGRGEISRRVTQNVVQDLSGLASKKPEVQNLLARYGITLKKNSSEAN